MLYIIIHQLQGRQANFKGTTTWLCESITENSQELTTDLHLPLWYALTATFKIPNCNLRRKLTCTSLESTTCCISTAHIDRGFPVQCSCFILYISKGLFFFFNQFLNQLEENWLAWREKLHWQLVFWPWSCRENWGLHSRKCQS